MRNLVTQIIILCIVAAVGNVLFKMSADSFGDLNFSSFLTVDFIKALFTTRYGLLVFISLAFNLASRFLAMAPLSTERLSIVVTMTAPITTLLSVIAGVILFRESLATREIIGIVLAIISVVLMSAE